MTRLRFLLVLLLSAAAWILTAPGAALASTRSHATATTVPVCTSTVNLLNGVGGGLGLPDGGAAGTINFSESDYTANEDAGQVWITITRTSTSGVETVYYGVNQATAQAPADFTLVPATEAALAPGQASCQFPVTIVDNGMDGPSIQATPYMWGSSRAVLPADPTRATLTILRNDPIATRNPTNPLDLASTPTNGDPLTGAHFYVQPYQETAAGKAMMVDQSAGNTSAANALKFIANQPFGFRFWFWKTPADPAADVARYLETAEQQQPGSVVELSTYSVVHDGKSSTANAAFTKRYLTWIHGLAQGIGNTRVVLFFELDSLITTSGLTPAQQHIRLVDQLNPAIRILEADCPHLALYLDSGSSNGLSPQHAAQYLREAGVQNAQGFFVNSTQFNWDTTEIQFGQKISNLLGGHIHFLVSSGVNGRGPMMLHVTATHEAENLCNPATAGLGTMSTQTGYKNVDGLLWFAPVGNSGGACRAGAPATAVYWPSYAVSLYNHRAFGITGPKLNLEKSGTYAPYDASFAG